MAESVARVSHDQHGQRVFVSLSELHFQLATENKKGRKKIYKDGSMIVLPQFCFYLCP
jgi:hypothetical protein